MTARHRVFARMWGVAIVCHLAGNFRYGDLWPDLTIVGLALGFVGLLGTALILWPRRGLLLLVSGLVPVAVVLELPDLSNHWLLAGFVSMAYFITAGRWERFEPIARWILLVAYAFAAFAKLNSGFTDPVTSCALHYLNEIFVGVGAAAISPASPVGAATGWVTAACEVSVPLLLFFRPTRAWGVLVGVGLHGVMSLDPAQHFYAFTGVLLPLFVLFLDDGFAERFWGIGDSVRPWIQTGMRLAVGVVGVAVTLASVTPLNTWSFWFLTKFSFVWWIPYLLFVFVTVVRSMRPTRLVGRLAPVGFVVVALVAMNGLTPYLELKTATAWNMYANLVTVDGESNHYLIRETLPLRTGHEGLVTIVSSPDAGLQPYVETGYLLPWPSFVTYLSDHPGVEVVYERDGQRQRVTASDDLGPVPTWWRFLPLRAVHGTQPDRCQIGYLPAL